MIRWFLLIFFVINFTEITSEKPKILIFFTTFGYSHFNFDCTIAKWLVESGYEVHAINPYIPGYPNYTCEAVTHTHSLTLEINTTSTFFADLTYGVANLVTSGSRLMLADINNQICTNLFENPELQEILTRENFTIAISEFVDNCLGVYFRKIGPKTIINLSAIPLVNLAYQNLGIPMSPSYVPVVDEAYPSGDRMTYLERMRNLYVFYYENYINKPAFDNTLVEFTEKFFPDGSVQPLDILKSVSLVVSNNNLFLDFAKPSSPKIIHVGGEMIKGPRKLDANIEKIFALPSDGVIFISFGTLVDTNKATETFKESIRAVVEAFPRLQFIWKTTGNLKTDDFNNYSNLHLVNWIDQQSILANPKTKLFFTHCGLNSLNEAAVFGIPMITMPIFGDQHYNSALVNKRQIGIAISYLTVNPQNLVQTFHEILNDPKYTSNAKLLAAKIKDNPIKGKDAFLKWIEFLGKYGNNEELVIEAVGMPLWKYYCLDIIGPLILGLSLTLYFTFKIIQILILTILNLKKSKLE